MAKQQLKADGKVFIKHYLEEELKKLDNDGEILKLINNLAKQ